MDRHAGWCRDRAMSIHGDVDRSVGSPSGTFGRTECRLTAQRGRRGEEDRCPGALLPRRVAGVVDMDARVDEDPLSAPQQAADLALGQPVRQRLAAGHHARLEAQDVSAGVTETTARQVERHLTGR
jgi:hypothetical protein